MRSMAAMRFVSAATEITAAVLMLRAGRVETALRINGLLGLVGPVVLVSVSLLGVAGMAGRIPAGRVVLILIGVYLIIAGSRG